MLEAMFRRYYSWSIGLPWVSTPERATYNAIYRMSIIVAAPVVLLVSLLELLLIYANPLGLLGRNRAVVLAGSLGIASLVVYSLLLRMFRDYAPAVLNQDKDVDTIQDWILDVVGWLCIAGYIVAIASV
jgi:hypothetical protein